MKITIKTLQQKLFTVDVDPDDTVATIKSKISDEHGHAAASQRLIYSGKFPILVSSLYHVQDAPPHSSNDADHDGWLTFLHRQGT
jgi:Ubiquitin family